MWCNAWISDTWRNTLSRRDVFDTRSNWDNLETICIDEVSYKKRHHYFTIISDYFTGQIIEIIEGRFPKGPPAYKKVASVLKKIKRKLRLKIKWVSLGEIPLGCGFMETISENSSSIFPQSPNRSR